nr:MAG: E6 [Pan troglodytes papillomavirus 1]WCI99990.1 MAG: E6 [Pan troglodytes papillomavirus 1]
MFSVREERPLKLHDLCEALETSIHEIELQCIYCDKILCRQEVYDFAFTDLFIVYRGGNAFGVCQKCLKFHSKIRRLRRYQQSVYGATLEQLTKQQLCDILIRCYVCQKPLCPVEKQRHLDNNKRFHQIFNGWTGRCIRCWRPSSSETQV